MDQKWEDAVVRAAAEASRLQPLATGLMIAAVLGVFSQGLFEPLMFSREDTGYSQYEAWNEFGRNLLRASPSFALIWGLFETRNYLARLSKGELWGPATMKMLGKVGDALIAAAVIAMLLAPTIEGWIDGDVGIRFEWEPIYLALAGLGLLLSLIARVVRNVVEVAAQLKAENDQIV